LPEKLKWQRTHTGFSVQVQRQRMAIPQDIQCDRILNSGITDSRRRSEIHKLINSILIKEELPDHRKESIIVPIYKKGD
jgi:hypothetical protein